MIAALLIHAFVDGYYERGNGLNLDLAAVEFVKEPAPAGFHLTLAAGNAADILHRHVYQASAIYKPNERLTFEGGIYPSHIGFEGFFTKDNWNYTRGWLGELSPYYQTGVRTAYRFSPRWSAELHVINGWQLVRDNDRALAAGAKVAYAGDRLSASYNTFDGPDNHHWRHFGDLIATWKATPSLSLGGSLDRGRQQFADWTGVAAYARCAFRERHAVAVRAERFRDPEKRIADAARIDEVTATYEVRPAPRWILKLEGRRDRLDGAPPRRVAVVGAVATF